MSECSFIRLLSLSTTRSVFLKFWVRKTTVKSSNNNKKVKFQPCLHLNPPYLPFPWTNLVQIWTRAQGLPRVQLTKIAALLDLHTMRKSWKFQGKVSFFENDLIEEEIKDSGVISQHQPTPHLTRGVNDYIDSIDKVSVLFVKTYYC